MNDHRIIAIVEAAAAPQVAAVVTQVLGGYQVEFTTGLSPTGAEPATHYAASAQLDETQRNTLLGLLNPDAGIYGWRGLAAGVDDFDGPNVVTDANNLPTCAPADMRWTFEACCQSLGLKRIQADLP